MSEIDRNSNLIGTDILKYRFGKGRKTQSDLEKCISKILKRALETGKDICIENLNFKASYSGLPDAKFKVKGIGLSKSQTWIGAGVLNEVSSKFAWYLNYDGKIDKKAKNNVFTAGMRVNF